jgi:ABC-2 type transport system permease protein
MKKTLIILRHEFRQTIRSRSFILLTMALPLIVLLGYGIYQGVQHGSQPSTAEEVKIGYVDQTGEFNEYTSQSDILFVPFPDEGEARDALLGEEVEEYFVIPSDYISSGAITRYTTKTEVEVPSGTLNGMAEFLLSNMLSGQVSPEVLERTQYPLSLDSLRLDESGEVTPAKNAIAAFLVPTVFAFIFYFALLLSATHLLQSVTEEKENRVIEIILSSVSPRQLLTGKVLGLGAAGLIQIAVWLLTVRVFAQVASVNIPVFSDISISWGLLGWGVIYFALGYLLFAALYAGVGAISSSAKEAQSWSAIVVMPAVLPMILNWLIVSNPEGAVSKALTLFPLTAPTVAMMRLPNDAISGWELGLSLAIMLGTVALTMWAAAKIFRAYLLMYGKRPSLKEIFRYVTVS